MSSLTVYAIFTCKINGKRTTQSTAERLSNVPPLKPGVAMILKEGGFLMGTIAAQECQYLYEQFPRLTDTSRL